MTQGESRFTAKLGLIAAAVAAFAAAAFFIVVLTISDNKSAPNTEPLANAVVEVTFTNHSSEGQGSVKSSPKSLALESRYWSFDDLKWTGWGTPRAVAKGFVSNGATADPSLAHEPTTVILTDLQVCNGVPHYLGIKYFMNKAWRTGSHEGCSLVPDPTGGI